MSAISIRGAGKRFGTTVAVRDLDLDVPQGSLTGFLGPNGAGKSTTIRMIMSIIYPDQGSIEVLGGSALGNKDRIGYLPEERGVYRKMRVGDFVRYIARLKGRDERGFDKTIEEWLERIELPGVARKKCEELSKGMQQKVQFLAAIIHDPELVILDEPFSGLDPVNAEVIHRLVDDLRSEGRTIIFSTHILSQAERLCDRIVLINHGEKILDDSLPAIRDRFDPRGLEVEPPLGQTAEDVAALLETCDGVTTTRALESRVELDLDDAFDPHAVMQSILARSEVRSLRMRRASLEDVFVRLVSRDRGEAAAREAREALATS